MKEIDMRLQQLIRGGKEVICVLRSGYVARCEIGFTDEEYEQEALAQEALAQKAVAQKILSKGDAHDFQ
jgi:hypothetical protein